MECLENEETALSVKGNLLQKEMKEISYKKKTKRETPTKKDKGYLQQKGTKIKYEYMIIHIKTASLSETERRIFFHKRLTDNRNTPN